MKIVFMVYHDILEERINKLLLELNIDYYTEWDNVKGKGHHTEAHLGDRTFPGYNSVRMIAIQDEITLNMLSESIVLLNKDIVKDDDKVRLFQVPLEKIT